MGTTHAHQLRCGNAAWLAEGAVHMQAGGQPRTRRVHASAGGREPALPHPAVGLVRVVQSLGCTAIPEASAIPVWDLARLQVRLLLWRTFRKWTADQEDAFDLRDFIMENGKASAIKLWLNGSFGATTWGFVYLLMSGKGSETLLLAYGGLWVTPLLARIVKDGISSGQEKP